MTRAFAQHQLVSVIVACSLLCTAAALVEDGDDVPEHKRTKHVCGKDFPVQKDGNASLQEPFWLAHLEEALRLEPVRPPPLRDITIVTLLSLDRVQPLRLMCSQWPGTVAAALYVPLVHGTVRTQHSASGPNASSDLASTLSHVRRVHKDLQPAPGHIEASMPLRCGLRLGVYTEALPELSEWWGYPVNALRNRALALADSELVFLLDGDFVPGPPEWNHRLFNDAQMYQEMLIQAGNKVLLVVNAVEVNRWNFDLHQQQRLFHQLVLNGSRALLLAEVEAGHVEAFQEYGHRETNWTHWLQATEPYEANYTSFDGFRPAQYEPYVIASRAALPWYDERYRGYHFNKLSFIYHLFRLGFRFIVSPDCYVMHYAHERTQDNVMNTFKHRLSHLYYAVMPYQMEYTHDYMPFVNDWSLCERPGNGDTHNARRRTSDPLPGGTLQTTKSDVSRRMRH